MHTKVQALSRALFGVLACVASLMAPPAAANDYPLRPEVRAFMQDLVARHAFDAQALDALFAQVRRSDTAIRLMTPAPTGAKRSWQAYRARFIDANRIETGLRFWHDHAATVARASQHYGVPEEIIIAIIGVETVFGRITGEHRVIDVLSTLSFDYLRRADYFRSELEQFLLLARTEGFDPLEIRGSYAGAIGLPQFMPGSIRRWAVDFDGDGRVDLRHSTADAIGSVANFLAEHGWQPGAPARYAVRIADPRRIGPLIDAGITPSFTPDALRDYGVASLDPVGEDTRLALIDLPNGDDPPDYWLGAQNFFVITRYNRSSFYASAVLDLAEALRRRSGP
ncbi:MAG: lytic murein transglycosylase B [Burkholderiaceae bacterium]